jgi:hypothetical protein
MFSWSDSALSNQGGDTVLSSVFSPFPKNFLIITYLDICKGFDCFSALYEWRCGVGCKNGKRDTDRADSPEKDQVFDPSNFEYVFCLFLHF